MNDEPHSVRWSRQGSAIMISTPE